MYYDDEEVREKLLPALSRNRETRSATNSPRNTPKFLRSTKQWTQRSIAQQILDCEPGSNQNLLPKSYLEFRSKEYTRKVNLNVGGEIFEVYWHILDRHAGTRLWKLRRVKTYSKLQQICDDYSLEENEYFFDRSPNSFRSILNFYKYGILHLAEEMCLMAFTDDLDYWGINELKLGTCCHHKFTQRKENVMEEMKNEADALVQDSEEIFGEGRFVKFQKLLWDVLEQPTSSFLARIVAIISILFIVVSTVALCLNTMPQFLEVPCSQYPVAPLKLNCTRMTKSEFDSYDFNLTIKEKHDLLVENHYFTIIEDFCITWFTLEYVLRLAASPNKLTFLKGGLNNIDLLAIMPYYIAWAFRYIEQQELKVPGVLVPGTVKGPSASEQFADVRRIIQVFRIMRIMRVFKLARHSVGLQSLGFTLINSYKELCLLVMFLAMGVLMFSSLLYFAEKEGGDDNDFESIPKTFWWAVISMTTVGYGDMIPKTTVGKLIGAQTCICGILVVAFPIPIIVNNFTQFYKDQSRREKAITRKEELERARKEGRFFSHDRHDHDTAAKSQESLDHLHIHHIGGLKSNLSIKEMKKMGNSRDSISRNKSK